MMQMTSHGQGHANNHGYTETGMIFHVLGPRVMVVKISTSSLQILSMRTEEFSMSPQVNLITFQCRSMSFGRLKISLIFH